jgi:putative FmdB family regulatory protein
MPIYDFRCRDCGSDQELLVALAEAETMVLVCTGCGGEMQRRPPRVAGLRSRPGTAPVPTAARASAACGHGLACRCGGVRLSRPNPFKQEIEAELKPSQQK